MILLASTLYVNAVIDSIYIYGIGQTRWILRKKSIVRAEFKNNVYICIRIHHPFPFRSEIAARRYEDRRRNDRKGGCPKPTGACV